MNMLHFLIAFTGILLLIYALLIFFYHRIWDLIPQTIPPSVELSDPLINVSVIIPARNEANRIRNCLDSLLAQSYPSVNIEIIIVNDFSTDETAVIISNHPLKSKLINLSDFISGDI